MDASGGTGYLQFAVSILPDNRNDDHVQADQVMLNKAWFNKEQLIVIKGRALARGKSLRMQSGIPGDKHSRFTAVPEKQQ
jgi:hypothetical protein